jgi:Flp pilus assembly protein TadD
MFVPRESLSIASRGRFILARAARVALERAGWIVALTATAVYVNTVGNGPVLDDGWVIFDNSLIKSLSNIPRIFHEPYNVALSGANGGLYRPVTLLTYALNYAFGGSNVVGYHLVNVALHVLCSLAVLELARLFVGRSRAGAAAPLVAALLFALHPVHVEAVTAMVGRAEVLAALGSLGCLYLTCTRRRSWWRLGAALVVLALGVLSKENAAVTPILWLLVAIALPSAAGLEARPGFRAADRRRALVQASVIAAAMACAAAAYFVLRPGVGPAGGSRWFDGQPGGVIFNTMTRALAEYLQLLVLPYPLGVDFYYSNKIPFTHSFTLACVAATAAWLAVLAFGVVLLRRSPVIGLGILWIFVALLPVLNIVPIGVLMAERLLYLPSVGFCIAAGAGAAMLFDRVPAQRWLATTGRAVLALMAIAVVAFAAITWKRNADWRNALTLWEAELRKEPQDVVVNNNLAVEYTSRGELAKARERLEVALRTNPFYWRAHVNMGIVAHKLRDDATAVRSLEEAHRIDPSAASPDFFMAQVLADQGNFSGAIDYLARAERADPLDARTPLFQGWYLYQMGRLEEATAELRRAAMLDPGDPQAGRYLSEIARKK